MRGNRLLVGLLAGLFGLTLSLFVWLLDGFNDWEARTYDWRARELAGQLPPSDRVVMILVDQNSLDWAQEFNGIEWPWPRQLYAVIADFCRKGGAAAIGFDVLFTEPSFYGESDDREMADALARQPNSVAVAFLSEKSGKSRTWPASVPPSRLKIDGLDEWLADKDKSTISFPRAAFPITAYAESASHLANVQLAPDPDGIFRRLPLFALFQGNQLPTLGLGVYLASEPAMACRLDDNNLRVGATNIPLDRKGQALLRFRGPSGTHTSFSAAAILQSAIREMNNEASGPVDPEEFRDKIVLLGFSAPGLMDLRSSPVDSVYPGVEIHATLVDNLLSGDFISEVSVKYVILLIFLLSLLAGLTVVGLDSAWLLGLTATGLVCIPIAFGFTAYSRGYWLPIVAMEAAVILTILASLTGRYLLEGRQKRFIKNAFSQYLSPIFIEELIRNPERLKLGGERKVLTMFFSDLQGFTSISEKMDPEELTAFLNLYLTAMTDIIHEEGGTVDKYEGDAIIAFWNAPLDMPDHAARAVSASLRCLKKLEEMQPELKKWVDKEVRMRIGINTGPAVVGNMGSHDRFDYTMLGDAVNLAARLEGVNKQFGTWVLISEDTKKEAGEAFPVRQVAKVTVVGRAEPLSIYEPLSRENYCENEQKYERFQKGFLLFSAGDFMAARQIFEETLDGDPVARAYADKCELLIGDNTSEWDGVWRITEKG